MFIFNSTGDGEVGIHLEVQFFDNEQDVEVNVAYPNVGQGKFTVNYVEVYVVQVQNSHF